MRDSFNLHKTCCRKIVLYAVCVKNGKQLYAKAGEFHAVSKLRNFEFPNAFCGRNSECCIEKLRVPHRKALGIRGR